MFDPDQTVVGLRTGALRMWRNLVTVFGRFGVWASSRQWPSEPAEIAAVALELEQLGYDTVWLGGATADLELPEQILAATSKLKVATGIVNIWQFGATDVAASHHRVTASHPDRFVLGIGVGHAPFDKAYVKPISKLGWYLDELDTAETPVPNHERIVAALGPRALRIAAERTLGTHPYLVPPEHTADARAILGAGPVLAPEQKVFLGTDAAEARRAARRSLRVYLQLPNYLNNLRKYGLTDDDFAGDGSDRFVDTLVAWGDEAAIRRRVDEHLAAGADHVALQVLSSDKAAALPLPELRQVSQLLS